MSAGNKINNKSPINGQLYRLLLGNCADITWVLDGDILTDANPAAAKTLGYESPNDLIGLTLQDISPELQPDGMTSHEKASTCIAEAIDKGSSAFEWVHKKKDGTPINCQISLTASHFPQKTLLLSVGRTISNRKHTIEQLKETAKLHHIVFEQSPFPVAINKLSGEYVDVNAEFCKAFGLTRNEIIGRSITELGLIDPATQHAIKEAFQQAGGVLDQYEIMIHLPSEQIRHMLLSSRTIDFRGDPHILSIINDITDRRDAEEALRRSEEKYRELVQNANSIILRWDSHGRLRFFNEFAQKFFGYSEDEVLDKSVIGTIVPKTETSGRDLISLMDEICRNPMRYESNINENMRKNGDRVWIAWTNKPVFDDQGKLREILSIGVDITDRRKAQQALKEREEMLQAVISNAPVVLFAINNRMVFTLSEGFGLNGLGLAPGEIVGHSVYELYGDNPEIIEVIERSLEGEPQHLETSISGGWYESWYSPVRDENGRVTGVIGVGADITARKQAEEALQESKEMLRLVLNTIPSKVFWKDRNSIYLGCNRRFAINAGIDYPEDIAGKSDFDLPWTKAESEGYIADDQIVINSEEPKLNYEETQYTAKDKLTWIRTNKVPLKDASGHIIGVLGTFEDITELKRMEDEKRQFYRETISSVTDGKLLIVDSDETMECEREAEFYAKINTYAETTSVRKSLEEYCRSKGLTGDTLTLFMTGAGEAMTNAIKHAGSGDVFAGYKAGEVWIGISDTGPGIAALALPKATLRRGYSTKVSLGMGYSIILDVADRTMLNTGPKGTTVVLLKKLTKETPSFSLDDLPDTWESI